MRRAFGGCVGVRGECGCESVDVDVDVGDEGGYSEKRRGVVLLPACHGAFFFCLPAQPTAAMTAPGSGFETWRFAGHISKKLSRVTSSSGPSIL